jgi:Response regulator containing a CheY-like receiver domain and an HTH DNA-binding domain
MSVTKLFFVDDESLLLDSLEVFFEPLPEFTVVGKAESGEEALEKLKRAHPDLILIDLNMTGMGGINLITSIKSIYPDIKILVLTTYYDEKNIISAVFNGADGYILKSAGRESIINAVRNTISGQSVLDNKVMSTLHSYVEQAVNDKEYAKYKELEHQILLNGLTSREKEICQLVGEGKSNLEIADTLHLTEGTVKNYLSHIYSKMDLRDRLALAVIMTRLK